MNQFYETWQNILRLTELETARRVGFGPHLVTAAITNISSDTNDAVTNINKYFIDFPTFRGALGNVLCTILNFIAKLWIHNV